MWKLFICSLAIKHSPHSCVRPQSWRLWSPPSIRPILCRTAWCGGGWGQRGGWWRRRRRARPASSWRPAGNAAASSCLFSSLWRVCSGTRSSPEAAGNTARRRSTAAIIYQPSGRLQRLAIFSWDSLHLVASWQTSLLVWQLPPSPETLCCTLWDKPWI